MKILKTPAKTLIMKAKPVAKFDKKLAGLVAEMIETLKNARDPEGVGLAAPQVGVSKQVFIMQANTGKKDEKPRYKAFINPEIVARARIKKLPNSPNMPNSRKSSSLESGHRTEAESSVRNRTSKHVAKSSILEGCLSIENVWGSPQRFPWVKLKYQDLSGIKFTQKLSGFPARIVQHEIDHLNGILFTRRVLEQRGQLYRIEQDEATNRPTFVPLDI